MQTLGQHMLIELWEAELLDDVNAGEDALVATVRATGATLLDTRMVPFPNGGYSGVCILAESHLTIHTWPEHGYAAIDMFTCGPNMDYDAGLEMLTRHFRPGRIQVQTIERGVMPGLAAAAS
jgi:S-adenosylmethionine decarboxylase proenzyme